MERLDYYRQCIQKLLIEQGKVKPINGEIEVETIFYLERDRYLVIDLGWDQHRRIYNCVMHLDIKDGKIWIERNQTDKVIADLGRNGNSKRGYRDRTSATLCTGVYRVWLA